MFTNLKKVAWFTIDMGKNTTSEVRLRNPGTVFPRSLDPEISRFGSKTLGLCHTGWFIILALLLMVPSPSRSSLEKNRSISVLEKLHLNEIVDVTSRISDPGGVVPDPDLTLEKNRIWIRNRIILSRITGSDQQNSPFFSWILKETFILVGFWTWMFRPDPTFFPNADSDPTKTSGAIQW